MGPKSVITWKKKQYQWYFDEKKIIMAIDIQKAKVVKTSYAEGYWIICLEQEIFVALMSCIQYSQNNTIINILLKQYTIKNEVNISQIFYHIIHSLKHHTSLKHFAFLQLQKCLKQKFLLSDQHYLQLQKRDKIFYQAINIFKHCKKNYF
eukprot:EC095680.1.p1 GENE.EC095680.1~~EC095680.1.p1  ORF type:complete len:150 (-),score=5.34 EC095680.1:58-507(-)